MYLQTVHAPQVEGSQVDDVVSLTQAPRLLDPIIVEYSDVSNGH